MVAPTKQLSTAQAGRAYRRFGLSSMALAGKRIPRRANWLGLGVIVLVLVVWQILVSAGVIRGSAMASPTEILSGLKTASDEGVLWPALAHTVGVIAVTGLLSIVLGAVIGLVIGLSTNLFSWGNATIDVLRSIPTIAFFPTAVLLWGASTKAEIVITVYAAIWPVVVGTARSVRTINPRLFDVGHSFRFSRFKTFYKLMVPATASATIVAARISLGVAVIASVTMEMVGTPAGVGYEVLFYQRAGNIAPMWAFIILTGFLGVVINLAFVWIVRLLFPGVALWTDRGRR